MTLSCKTRPYVFLLSIVFTLQLTAQYSSNPLVINYDHTDYRAANKNWTITFDSLGIAFFGNNSGLLEFDGSNWLLHTLPEHAIARSVASDGGKRIYVGSYEEFGYMERNTRGQLRYVSLSKLLEPSELHNDEIWRIVIHKGKVYFQSFWRIFIYDGEDIEIIRPGRAIVLLMKARDRLFIHKVRTGLYEINDNRMEFIPGSELLADDEIKTIMPYGESGFLLGADSGGLFIYRENELVPWAISMAEEIASAEINGGIYINGLYFIGTIAGGLYILEEDGRLRYHLYAGNSLTNNTIQYMAADRFDNVWVASSNGLSYINMNSELGFHIDPSGDLGSVYAAALYEDKVYLGTDRGLFTMDYNKGSPSNLQMHESIRGQVWSLKVIDNALYCGHTTGTFRFTKNDLELVSPVNGGFDIKKIMVAGKEYLIQSTYSSLVVYEKRGNNWEYYDIVDGYIEPTKDIEYDHLGNLWTAHLVKGIFKVKLGFEMDSVLNVRYYGKDQGLPVEKHLGVAKVENRIVFTSGQQIFRYDDINDTIIPYTQLNKKLDGYAGANAISKGRQNNYWFIKDHQIAYYNISNNEMRNLFSYDLARQGVYMVTNSQNIIPFSDSLYCICLDNGFAIYQTNDQQVSTTLSKVCIREITARDKAGNIRYLSLIADEKDKKIKYSYRNLNFVFSSIQSCKIPEFSYRLRGLDNGWSKWTSGSKVSYSRLPSGKYAFEVRTRDVNGNVSEAAVYSFMIRPIWYLSKVALIVYSLLLVSTIIIIRLLFLRRLKMHEARLEKEKRVKMEQEQKDYERRITMLKNEALRKEVSYKNIQLADYTMSMIRKNELLQRIKQELEKQKDELGSRYPNFFYDKLSKLMDKGIESEDEWKIFETHFDQAHENFFKRLLATYPELTQSDLKLCAYLRMNLSSKEIASLLNITTRGVEIARYRLRKRLKLETEDNLVEFILSF